MKTDFPPPLDPPMIAWGQASAFEIRVFPPLVAPITRPRELRSSARFAAVPLRKLTWSGTGSKSSSTSTW